MPSPETLRVTNDERDFYGRQYYESYLLDHYHYPKLADRVRTDLPERCVHWLRALLKFKLPPATVLELGSAHGGFVAMMRWAGFAATGLELSPWLVELSRTVFGIPVLQGPLEEQQVPDASLDAVVLMDVVEHLPEPETTLAHCLRALKSDGILLIQTPHYREGQSYEQMVATADPFLAQLKPEQHLFLFSDSSLRSLLQKLGVNKVETLPAIYAHYDMFLVASRDALTTNAPGEISARLTETSSGRLVDALLQLDDLFKEKSGLLDVAEADRAARLLVIENQGRQLGETEAQRNALQSELADLRRHFDEVEADRAARLLVIENQGRQLGETEAQRNALLSELADLRRHFDEVEADRAARLLVIENQGRQLGEVAAERDALQSELNDLNRRLDTLQTTHRETLQAQNAELGRIRLLLTRSLDSILPLQGILGELRPDWIPSFLTRPLWARLIESVKNIEAALKRAIEGTSADR
jgi:2-polyprenyl-3-methyl-5-hydroxy-6-metoxy-1,4-benzoquinol methylase/ribosomal protein S15P/S13E